MNKNTRLNACDAIVIVYLTEQKLLAVALQIALLGQKDLRGC